MQSCVGDDCFVITDATTYLFEIFKGSKYRKTFSYAPDSYVAHFPSMKQRERFIICRNLFKAFWKREE